MRVLRVRRFRVALGIIITLLAATIVPFVSRSVASGQQQYVTNSAVMQAMVQKTNDLRGKQALETLLPSEQLVNSATAKLADMQQKNYWSHYAPDGTSFSSFVWQYDSDANVVGENLAYCYQNYDDAFNALVASPTHYAVLTGEFTNIGIASQTLANGCESIVMHVSK